MTRKAKKPTTQKASNDKYTTRRPLDDINVPDGDTFGGDQRDTKQSDSERKKEVYVQIFKAALSEGLDKREIKKLLGLRDNLFEIIEKKVINEDGQSEISKASPYRYYEYLQRQEKCVNDLEYFTNKIDDEIIFYENAQEKFLSGELEKMPAGRANTQGAIMAIKAKSDIIDKMIKTGQELGIVEKRAKELRVLGNINLAALPTEELKTLLTKKMGEMNSLTKKDRLPSVYTKMLEAQVSNNEATVINNDEEN